MVGSELRFKVRKLNEQNISNVKSNIIIFSKKKTLPEMCLLQ